MLIKQCAELPANIKLNYNEIINQMNVNNIDLARKNFDISC